MNPSFQIILSVIIIILIVLSSQLFYRLYMYWYVSWKLRQLKFDLGEITYSLEKMIYFVTLPSIDSEITSAEPDQIIVRADFDSMLFPRFEGLRIMLRDSHKKERVIAYLSAEHFGVPMLNNLFINQTLSAAAQNRISAFRMMHPTTIREIQMEVHRNLIQKPQVVVQNMTPSI
jgi:hypothetical protein